MTQALEYERPTHRPPSRVIAFLANATAAYPLLVLASLYGQWLLSWWVLGHRPRPLLDDPGSINGARWMNHVTFLTLLMFMPMAGGALATNTLHAVRHRIRGRRLLTRIGLIAALWIGTVVLFRWDPARVGYWWID